MQLHIWGQTSHIIECLEDDSVAQIKAKLLDLEQLEQCEITLSCAGKILADDVLAKEIENTTLDLTVPILGGKVHGSLARAGKVKGATPKVEKQEKSKKKTGRAKRRIQYNRRFVNVVQTYGRRRGPNANPNT